MYLSRVEIDRENRKKIKDLSHLGAYHHWVESSFPEEFEQTIRTRKLWRLDRLGGKEYLLIVSEDKPSIEALERYGVKGTGEVKDYDPFLQSLEEGKRYRFKAVLNPVISRIEKPGQKRGRVMPHVTIEHQMKFLLDRSEKNGFALEEDSFYITDRGFYPLNKNGGKTQRLIRVTYEGVLTITDKELFMQTLTKGFGKKKAYGFGMMTVIPEE